jgi:hypothetical protein
MEPLASLLVYLGFGNMPIFFMMDVIKLGMAICTQGWVPGGFGTRRVRVWKLTCGCTWTRPGVKTGAGVNLHYFSVKTRGHPKFALKPVGCECEYYFSPDSFLGRVDFLSTRLEAALLPSLISIYTHLIEFLTFLLKIRGSQNSLGLSICVIFHPAAFWSIRCVVIPKPYP